MATGTIFGVGIGVFVLAIIWCLAAIACIAFTRSQGFQGAIGPIAGAVILTVVLIQFPREKRAVDDSNIERDIEIVDSAFLPRLALVVTMIGCTVAAAVLLVRKHLSAQIRAKPIIKPKQE